MKAAVQNAPRYRPIFGDAAQASASFWTSLRYFNLYRIAVAALFFVTTLVYGDALNLGSHNLPARAAGGSCDFL